MAKTKNKDEKANINNIETRLKDIKDEYNFNRLIIEKLANSIDVNKLIVKNGNNTESATPNLRTYIDLVKINSNLRKQINDMEIIISNGTIKSVEEENPFSE